MSSSTVASTNVRIGPGFYLAIKHISETSGLSMGTVADFFLAIGLVANQDVLKAFPDELKTAMTADALSALGDVLKLVGLGMMKDPKLSELYRVLLGAGKDGNPR